MESRGLCSLWSYQEGEMKGEIKRYWINQPSTMQPLHHLHGTNVLAIYEYYGSTSKVYFLSGEVISMQVP
jgi:hypothetical protein